MIEREAPHHLQSIYWTWSDYGVIMHFQAVWYSFRRNQKLQELTTCKEKKEFISLLYFLSVVLLPLCRLQFAHKFSGCQHWQQSEMNWNPNLYNFLVKLPEVGITMRVEDARAGGVTCLWHADSLMRDSSVLIKVFKTMCCALDVWLR